MKKIGFIIEIVAAGLLFLLSCEEENVSSTRTTQTIYADIEEDNTKVSLEKAESGRDLIARWQEDDIINVFLLGSEYCEVGGVTLKSINSDGKGCVFTYDIPESFSRPVDGYRLLCFAGNSKPILEEAAGMGNGGGGGGGGGGSWMPHHTSSTKAKKNKDLVLLVNASLTRAPLNQFRAPVLFNGFVTRDREDVSFSHYFTYELLHVNNLTENPITFSHLGFVGTLWYKERGSICIDDGSFIIFSNATQEPVFASPDITIPPHSSDIIVSSYIPNGQAINNVRLTARINGDVVTSTNTLTSAVKLQKGHAYHMYATWDGKDYIRAFAKRVPTNDPLWPDKFYRFMIGMVAQWVRPEIVHAHVSTILLTGPQGIHKSTFFKLLLPEELRFGYKDHLDFKNEKDALLSMSRYLLINVDEFDRITKRQQSLLKFILQETKVNIRMVKDRDDSSLPRMASMVGTSNTKQLLTDLTGSRRFICVDVNGVIDVDTPINYVQLYAQALDAVLRGERTYFTSEEELQLQADNKRFYVQDPLEQLFFEFFTLPEGDEEGEWMGVGEVLKELSSKTHQSLVTASNIRRMGQILKQLGVANQHKRDGNKYQIICIG